MMDDGVATVCADFPNVYCPDGERPATISFSFSFRGKGVDGGCVDDG